MVELSILRLKSEIQCECTHTVLYLPFSPFGYSCSWKELFCCLRKNWVVYTHIGKSQLEIVFEPFWTIKHINLYRFQSEVRQQCLEQVYYELLEMKFVEKHL